MMSVKIAGIDAVGIESDSMASIVRQSDSKTFPSSQSRPVRC